jgi:uncharacterized protein (TIGR00255 family)
MSISMTGSGESHIMRNGYDLSVFIRSVNHRYFQINLRLPRGYYNLESRIREFIRTRISRGKMDVHLEIFTMPQESQKVLFNKGLADQLIEFSKAASDEYGIPSGVSVEKLLRFPEIISFVPDHSKEDIFWSICQEALEKALGNLISERTAEGNHLTKQIQDLCGSVRTKVKKIEALTDGHIQDLKERLSQNIQKLGAGLEVSSERMEQEVVFFSIRADISEEVTRLGSHLNRLESLIVQSVPVGKKCDFLLQEMHREINTIGSKTSNIVISDMVVDGKIAIEKMREQIQNIE